MPNVHCLDKKKQQPLLGIANKKNCPPISPRGIKWSKLKVYRSLGLRGFPKQTKGLSRKMWATKKTK